MGLMTSFALVIINDQIRAYLTQWLRILLPVEICSNFFLTKGRNEGRGREWDSLPPRPLRKIATFRDWAT